MSGVSRHMPGCGCCGCTEFEDVFTRADSSNIGSDWSEESGAWEIASNKLKGTSNGIAVYNTAVSQNSYKVQAVVRSDTANDQVGLVAYYTDANNYYSVILDIGAGARTLKIFETSGGVTTERDSASVSAAAVDTDHTISLCITHDGSTARLVARFGASTFAYWEDSSPLTGPGKAGVYRKSAAGVTTWDDFAIDLTNTDTCPDCGIPCCFDELVPVCLKLVVSGLVDNTCTDCNELNGVEFTFRHNGGCGWNLESSGGATHCGEALEENSLSYISIVSAGGSDCAVEWRLRTVTSGYEIYGNATLASSSVFPINVDTLTSFLDRCDVSGATSVLSAC